MRTGLLMGSQRGVINSGTCSFQSMKAAEARSMTFALRRRAMFIAIEAARHKLRQQFHVPVRTALHFTLTG